MEKIYEGYEVQRDDFWSTLVRDDDDVNLIIKEPKGYMTPTRSEIRRRVLDIYVTNESIRIIKNMSRYFYYSMMQELGDIFVEAIAKDTKKEKAKYEHIFRQNHILSKLPGNTPFEKALFLFELIIDQYAEKNPGSDLLGFMGKAIPALKFDPETHTDYVLNHILDMKLFDKKKKFSILEKISLIKGFNSTFDVAREVDEKQVPNSDVIKTRRMREYEQVINASPFQRAMPNFNHKFANKGLDVEAPIVSEEKKQKIIILLDFSASMNQEDKQEWVVALLADRLKYASIGECEIFFSYYLNTPSNMKFTHIYDEKSVEEFWKWFSTRPNGGGTNLGMSVNFIGSQIEKGKLHNLDIDLRGEKVEILAIADGQDRVKCDEFLHKTNAISLMKKNDELKGLCLKNRGTYIYIDSQDKIKEYSAK